MLLLLLLYWQHGRKLMLPAADSADPVVPTSKGVWGEGGRGVQGCHLKRGEKCDDSATGVMWLLM